MEQAEIIALLTQYKYYILFPLLLIQGPVVAIIAGFLASKGLFALTSLTLVVILADIVNDIMIYAASRWGRWTIIARWGRYIGLTAARIEKADVFMEMHGKKALALGKLAYTFGAAMIALAGIARMRFLTFFLVCMAVNIPKSILFVFLGYYIGANVDLAMEYMNYVGVGILILLIIAGVMYWKRKKKG